MFLTPLATKQDAKALANGDRMYLPVNLSGPAKRNQYEQAVRRFKGKKAEELWSAFVPGDIYQSHSGARYIVSNRGERLKTLDKAGNTIRNEEVV